MKNRIHQLFRHTVIQHPVAVLMCMMCLAGFFSLYLPDFRLDASADSLLLENDQDLKIYREINRRYENRDFLLLTFTPGTDVFADETLGIIGLLRDKLQALEGVESVLSILDVPLVNITSTSLSELARNAKTIQDTGIDRNQAREEILHSPIFSELLLSLDGSTTALVINLPVDEEISSLLQARDTLREKRHATGLDKDEDGKLERLEREYTAEKLIIDKRNHETILEIRKLMRAFSEHGQLHLGGISMIADDMIRFVKNDLIRFGIGVLVFLILILSIIFGRFQWVLLPLISCFYAGIIMTGLLGFVNWPVTVISSNFISLMLILTMSMNIHLIVRYRELARNEPDATQPGLVQLTVQRMVRPCLYTALTSMIGFASLVVSQIKPVIHFGLMMTIGLLVTFLTTFILFPSLLMLFRRETAGPAVTRNRVTSWLGCLTERTGKLILIICLAVTVASVGGVSLLRVENSFINYFSEDTGIHQGQLLIDRKLGGTTPLDIVLDFEPVQQPEVPGDDDDEFADLDALFGGIESDPADSWFTEQRLDRISRVHDYLQDLEATGKVLSLASFLRVMQDVNRGQKTDAFEMALVYKRMPDDIRESLIDPYISINENQARINARIIDSNPDLRRDEFLRNLETGIISELAIPEGEFRLTGMLVLYNNMLQSLFKSQILTLSAVMIGIALMLWLLFRSWRLAVIGILPNLLAAVAILGLMGLFRIPLDMMTITIAAITIGIAVDDCIHYIYRFREEFPKHGNYLKTMHICHANIGTAMFYTSVTIIIGFSILILSNFIPTIIFGLLTTLAMFIALLAALTLLPELILLIRPFGNETE
ncbi:MAG: MMPL family transporter [Thiotrichales bacterium]|nr:MMPL family transporter [Thiotrichales bacterium]